MNTGMTEFECSESVQPHLLEIFTASVLHRCASVTKQSKRCDRAVFI
jgi:hypothetical protein